MTKLLVDFWRATIKLSITEAKFRTWIQRQTIRTYHSIVEDHVVFLKDRVVEGHAILSSIGIHYSSIGAKASIFVILSSFTSVEKLLLNIAGTKKIKRLSWDLRETNNYQK